jgi:DNA-binding NarL/FixJ family response regulator
VVLLTGRADAEVLRRAADVGVCSLLPKDGSLPELLTTVRTARLGELVVHPALLRTLAAAERPSRRSKRALSQREEEVLALMMTGLDSRSIADQLGISVHTCRGYVKGVLRKLDAHSALEAVAIARQSGWVEQRRLG